MSGAYPTRRFVMYSRLFSGVGDTVVERTIFTEADGRFAASGDREPGIRQKYFRDGEALGNVFHGTTPSEMGDNCWSCSDIKHRGLDTEAQPEYYLPHTQGPTGKWYWRSAVRKTRGTLPTLFSKNCAR